MFRCLVPVLPVEIATGNNITHGLIYAILNSSIKSLLITLQRKGLRKFLFADLQLRIRALEFISRERKTCQQEKETSERGNTEQGIQEK